MRQRADSAPYVAIVLMIGFCVILAIFDGKNKSAKLDVQSVQERLRLTEEKTTACNNRISDTRDMMIRLNNSHVWSDTELKKRVEVLEQRFAALEIEKVMKTEVEKK